MFRYETLILTIPEITKDESATLEFQVDKLVTKFKGSIISFERWGKYRLAYPVRKNDYGVYFLVRFEVEDNKTIVTDLNTLFVVKFSDIVMRNLVTRLDPNKPLEYQKPPSVEDAPKRNMSSFMEEKGFFKKGSRPSHGSDDDDSDFDGEDLSHATRTPRAAVSAEKAAVQESKETEAETTKEA
jgi:small subunit ribosomal protein S6